MVFGLRRRVVEAWRLEGGIGDEKADSKSRGEVLWKDGSAGVGNVGTVTIGKEEALLGSRH